VFSLPYLQVYNYTCYITEAKVTNTYFNNDWYFRHLLNCWPW